MLLHVACLPLKEESQGRSPTSIYPVMTPTVTRSARTSKRVVFPAPETPIRAVRAPGLTQPSTLSKIRRVSSFLIIAYILPAEDRVLASYDVCCSPAALPFLRECLLARSTCFLVGSRSFHLYTFSTDRLCPAESRWVQGLSDTWLRVVLMVSMSCNL